MMVIIYTTFSDKPSARKITNDILEKRKAACIQLFPIESTYWWKDSLTSSSEIGCFIKTSDKLRYEVVKSISDNHPYDTPEVITLNPSSVNSEYAGWLKTVVKV